MRGQRVLWAMVNVMLLSEARSRGYGIYRNVIRRGRLTLEGGGVLTKGRLRDILKQEDKSRILVGQLSNVGREVRSTTMHWAFESKKLDTTVKYLSWLPPWVTRDGEGVETERSLDPFFAGTGSRRVPDTVGLGRYPSQWWTMNCKYNAAYDVQRMNTKSALGDMSVQESVGGDRQERFEFVRDSPDLVAYMLALRTELLMRVVMPAVVRHSATSPYMAMARFETGQGGNPHYHGFSVGLPGPVMKRVRDDDGVHEDLVPMTVTADVRVFKEWLNANRESVAWKEGEYRSGREVFEFIRSALSDGNSEDEIENALFSDGSEDSCHSSMSAADASGDRITFGLLSRVRSVLSDLLEESFFEKKQGEGSDALEEQLYRFVLSRESPKLAPSKVAAGRRKGALEPVVDLSITNTDSEEVKTRSALEDEFYEFFKDIVCEWNPCYTEDGSWRYRWEEDIGPDVEFPSEILPEEFRTVESLCAPEELSSERRAQAMVTGKEPDRVNLRAVLDRVFAVTDVNGNVDIQSVRRLVGALVHRVARHTKHGTEPPQLNVHACARGKEGSVFCRYGFPHDCFPRGGERKMKLEKGDREGQWHAKFPRNDRLCCSYDPHILIANMGNIDWRPVLNLWAVVQYVTKYATKAPSGSRKLHEVLKDAVDEVCTYMPEGEGTDFFRRSIQKFFARAW